MPIYIIGMPSVFVVVGCAVLALGTSLFIIRNQRIKWALGNLKNYFNGVVKGDQLEGAFQGSKFQISICPVVDSGRPYLEISLYSNSAFTLQIEKETFLNKLSKKIGLVHEIRVNDSRFDDKYLLTSSYKSEKAISYLQDNATRQAIESLFAKGINSLGISYNIIWIRKSNYSLKQDLEIENVKNVLRDLKLLAEKGAYQASESRCVDAESDIAGSGKSKRIYILYILLVGMFVWGVSFIISGILLLFVGFWDPPLWLRGIILYFFNTEGPDYNWQQLKVFCKGNIFVMLPQSIVDIFVGTILVLFPATFFKTMLKFKKEETNIKKKPFN